MRIEKWKLLRDMAMSLLVFMLAVVNTNYIGFGIVAIAVINTIELMEVFAAWRAYRQEKDREHKRENK